MLFASFTIQLVKCPTSKFDGKLMPMSPRISSDLWPWVQHCGPLSTSMHSIRQVLDKITVLPRAGSLLAKFLHEWMVMTTFMFSACAGCDAILSSMLLVPPC